MRVVGYVRVSTRGQQDGTSLPEQMRQIVEYCAGRGYSLETIYQDVQSAENAEDREGFQEALAHIFTGDCDGLVVLRQDRWCRKVLDAERLREQFASAGKQLLSIADPVDWSKPGGRLTYNLLSAVNQYQRELTKDMSLAGKEAKGRDNGYVHGRPPYGYRAANGRLEPEPIEQHWIQEVFRLRKEGWMTWDIVKYLNEHRAPRKKAGTRWQCRHVDGILSRASRLTEWMHGRAQWHGLRCEPIHQQCS